MEFILTIMTFMTCDLEAEQLLSFSRRYALMPHMQALTGA